jgi:hypothetical protein
VVGSTFQQTQDCLVASQSEPACDTAPVDEP